MTDSSTIEELQARLQQYQQQQTVLEQALAADNTNSDLHGLKRDLDEAIKLTAQLLASKGAAPVAIPSSRTSNNAALSESVAEVSVDVRPYAIVQAYFSAEDQYTNARIIEVTDRGTCKVEILGFHEFLEAERQALKPAVLQNMTTLKEGSYCQAVFSEDGYYYNAKVKKIVHPGDAEWPVYDGSPALRAGLKEPCRFKVVFTDYGNEETVDCVSLRPCAPPEGATTGKKDKKEKTAADEAKEMQELVIPEHLKIQPEDNEKVREQKKKRIHAIKSNWRLKKAEYEREQAKTSWKSFDASIGKKRKSGGSLTSQMRKKGSMFATSDNPNAKVGVIGSGKGLTHFEDVQRKWQQNQQGQA